MNYYQHHLFNMFFSNNTNIACFGDLLIYLNQLPDYFKPTIGVLLFQTANQYSSQMIFHLNKTNTGGRGRGRGRGGGGGQNGYPGNGSYYNPYGPTSYHQYPPSQTVYYSSQPSSSKSAFQSNQISKITNESTIVDITYENEQPKKQQVLTNNKNKKDDDNLVTKTDKKDEKKCSTLAATIKEDSIAQKMDNILDLDLSTTTTTVTDIITPTNGTTTTTTTTTQPSTFDELEEFFGTTTTSTSAISNQQSHLIDFGNSPINSTTNDNITDGDKVSNDASNDDSEFLKFLDSLIPSSTISTTTTTTTTATTVTSVATASSTNNGVSVKVSNNVNNCDDSNEISSNKHEKGENLVQKDSNVISLKLPSTDKVTTVNLIEPIQREQTKQQSSLLVLFPEVSCCQTNFVTPEESNGDDDDNDDEEEDNDDKGQQTLTKNGNVGESDHDDEDADDELNEKLLPKSWKNCAKEMNSLKSLVKNGKDSFGEQQNHHHQKQHKHEESDTSFEHHTGWVLGYKDFVTRGKKRNFLPRLDDSFDESLMVKIKPNTITTSSNESLNHTPDYEQYCVFCVTETKKLSKSKKHPVHITKHCPVYCTNLERIARASEVGRCTRCLSAKHPSNQCDVPACTLKCIICDLIHLDFIHHADTVALWQ